ALSACGLIQNCSYITSFGFSTRPDAVDLRQNWVTPGYFGTVGIPLSSGRDFEARDDLRGARVSIVTESIANQYFAAKDQLGTYLDGGINAQIVGVVPDARSVSVHQPVTPMVYFPIAQPPSFRALATNLDVRVAGRPDEATDAVRQALRAAEPGLI